MLEVGSLGRGRHAGVGTATDAFRPTGASTSSRPALRPSSSFASLTIYQLYGARQQLVRAAASPGQPHGPLQQPEPKSQPGLGCGGSPARRHLRASAASRGRRGKGGREVAPTSTGRQDSAGYPMEALALRSQQPWHAPSAWQRQLAFMKHCWQAPAEGRAQCSRAEAEDIVSQLRRMPAAGFSLEYIQWLLACPELGLGAAASACADAVQLWWGWLADTPTLAPTVIYCQLAEVSPCGVQGK